MGQKTIRVNREGNVLTLDPPTPLDLTDDDWVEWQFLGLKAEEFGFISFDPSSPKLGPFHSLRTLHDASVLGQGNTAVQTEFSYWAMILKLDQVDPVASVKGTINNLASRRKTGPEITVFFEPGNPGLLVSPNPVSLNAGDTVAWRFVNTPAHSFACFKFDPDPAANGPYGPFAAFSTNGGEDSVQASGMGFVTQIPVDQWSKTYTYRLQLRSLDGKLLASHDPVIDNLGPPAPG